MRYSHRAALISVSLLMSLFAERHVGQEPKPDRAVERREAFAWMTTLGYPDSKDLPFVLVATGDWLQHGNDAPENRFQYGFLMEQRGKTFKVLSLDLEVQTFEKTPPKTETYKKVDFEILDLNKEARAFLAELKADPNQEKKPRRRMGSIFGPSLSARTEVFLLAWACSRRGLDDMAARLYADAFDREKVSDDLAHIEMWRGILQFGDPKVPRAELLSRFERITKNFTKSQHHARASETAALLKKMIAEDEEHARRRKTGKPFDQLAKEEQIAELIFQLRDQNGHQFMQPGYCDIFDRFGGDNNNTTAHKLVKIGYDAIPQLIEHLDDERFTRSVGFHRDFYFSHYVLRVSDCSLAILDEIAGLSFWEAKSTFSYMSMDKNAGDVKKRVEAWYAEFKKKGEKRFLTEATESGDRNSAKMGRRLLEKYPKEALPVLMNGARACKEGAARATLVGLVASCKGDEPLRFLLSELKDGPLAQPRLTAAEELHKRGRREGLSAMIAWWEKSVESKVGDDDPASWPHFIAEYLAHCGEVEAIQALAKDLRKRSVDVRLSVVDAVGGQRSFSVEKIPAKDPAKVAAAGEELLVGALDDTDERRGESGSRNGKDYSDPRVCDIAGHVLSELYPKKYSFDLSAPLGVRNRQLVIMKNVWRGANELPPLTVPEPRKIPAIPAETLRPLLDRYLAAGGEKRLAVRNEIEKLGLGALPGVIERRDKTSDKNDQALWNELAGRIASIIDEIEFAEQSAKPSATVKKRVEAFKGKPLDARALIETIGFMMKNGPNDAQGVRVVALRAGDGTGFSLKLDLLTNPKDAKGPPSQWGHSESVRVGKEHLRGQFGASSDAGMAQWREGSYPDLEKVLAQAAASAPSQPVEIRIHVAPEWRK